MRVRSMDPVHFESRLTMFDLGIPPHGGLAIGLGGGLLFKAHYLGLEGLDFGPAAYLIQTVLMLTNSRIPNELSSRP